MSDRHNVFPFPVARWAGHDPSAFAAELIALEDRDGWKARGNAIRAAIAELQERLAPMGLPRRMPGCMIAEWLNTAFAEEHRLRHREDRTG